MLVYLFAPIWSFLISWLLVLSVICIYTIGYYLATGLEYKFDNALLYCRIEFIIFLLLIPIIIFIGKKIKG